MEFCELTIGRDAVDLDEADDRFFNRVFFRLGGGGERGGFGIGGGDRDEAAGGGGESGCWSGFGCRDGLWGWGGLGEVDDLTGAKGCWVDLGVCGDQGLDGDAMLFGDAVEGLAGGHAVGFAGGSGGGWRRGGRGSGDLDFLAGLDFEGILDAVEADDGFRGGAVVAGDFPEIIALFDGVGGRSGGSR